MSTENSPFNDASPESRTLPYPPFPEGEQHSVRRPGGFSGGRPAPRFSFWRFLGKTFLWLGSMLAICTGLLFLLILVGIFFSMKSFSTDKDLKGLANAPVEKTLAGSGISSKKIVILPIEGVITESEFGFVRSCIQTAYEDDRLSGLILRVDSPGGTISGSDYYYHLLCELKKERKIPVYVSMGGIAASGGYYVSMVGDKIFAERSTITGSIGVISMMVDASDLCQKIGVKSNYIVSGKNKGMGDFTRPMSEEERSIWQGLIDESYEQFLSVIREGRPAFARKDDEGNEDDSGEENGEPEAPQESADPLRALADGRVYSAAAAKELGLIDEIGFLQDASEAMIENELKVPKEDVEVVRYKKSESLFSILGTETDVKTAAGRVASLVETLATPNLYYILPGTLPTPE